MQGNLSHCDSELISRYYDGELGRVERSQVESHILVCSSCKKMLEDLKTISSQYGAHLARQPIGIDTRETEEHVLDRLRREETPWWAKVKETFLSKKILVSATATACVALLLITVLRVPVPDSPSAIVASVSGDVSSIIILEIPETRQTILWFNERPEGQSL
ncbi:MAG: zf-HC2 domain-containing protein [Deltaproteobacteria bacterium]|nr:zf-HC2 domain-containing protein [Deltaproteobacteria bacterium]